MNSGYSVLTHAMLPEAALVIGALLVLGYDLLLGRRHRSAPERLNASLALATVALSSALFDTVRVGELGVVFGGALTIDSLTVAARAGVFVLALITLGVTAGARPPRHPPEYVALLLFATTGFSLMAAAHQLLIAFAALELASLSLYVLVGMGRDNPGSAEAGLKYFLFGGMASAFLLFGFSLIYGLTGEIDFTRISLALTQAELSPLLALALVMVLVGFGFKAAAAPFHLWAPDVYQGAPTPSAALVASASKLAGFVLFLRLLWPGLGQVAGSVASAAGRAGWVPVVALIAGASLLLGNLAALAQTNVRRLLAYSAIAHTGAMLLGVIAARSAGPGPVFYYVATYGVATAGAFGVIAVLERHGPAEKITDLAGLSRRSPLLAGCLFIFILSLAGVPPLAGFFGKFAVFAAALQLGGIDGAAGWLTFLAIGLSAVALYYYLVVLKQALVVAPPPDTPAITVPIPTKVALVAAAALIVVLGVLPSLVLGLF